MLNKIFTSNTRVKLFQLFFTNPEDKFYTRQIAGLSNIPYTAVRRELKNLTKTEILTQEFENNRKYYKINKNFFLYTELKNIILKTSGLAEILKKRFKNKNLDFVFIYGSYAKNKETAESDIDIFAIGDISSVDLHKFIKKDQETFLRQINFVLYSHDEFLEKVKLKNHFVVRVLEQPKIFLKGAEDGFAKFIKTGKA